MKKLFKSMINAKEEQKSKEWKKFSVSMEIGQLAKCRLLFLFFFNFWRLLSILSEKHHQPWLNLLFLKLVCCHLLAATEFKALLINYRFEKNFGFKPWYLTTQLWLIATLYTCFKSFQEKFWNKIPLQSIKFINIKKFFPLEMTQVWAIFNLNKIKLNLPVKAKEI